MKLAESCSRNFSAAVRTKGQRYFQGSRVGITATRSSIVEAEVRGSGGAWYDVSLDTSDPIDGLYASCSCPHFDRGYLCKHLWATILAADNAGLLEEFAGQRKIQVIPADDLAEPRSGYYHDDGYYDDHDDDDDDWSATGYRSRQSSANGRTKKGRQPKPGGRGRSVAWHRALEAAPAAETNGAFHNLLSAVRRERQILYVLDVSASVAADCPVVELLQREKRQDGQWGKLKPLKVRREKLANIASEEDRALLGELLGNRLSSSNTYGGYFDTQDWGLDVNRVALAPECHSVLTRLCATGRFGWVLSSESLDELRYVAWDAGAAWRLRIRISADDKQKRWLVAGELYRDDQTLPLAEAVYVATPDVVLFPDCLAQLDSSACSRWLIALRNHGQLTVPYADRARLLESLWTGMSPPEVVWPSNLLPEAVPATPQGCLRVLKPKKLERWGPEPARTTLYADVRFDYGGMRLPPTDARSAVFHEESERLMHRDRDREAELLKSLADLGTRPNASPQYARQPGELQFPAKRLDEVVSRLVADGWQVEAEGALIRSAGSFSLRVRSSGVDWFELESDIDFGGISATLPQLLAAARAGERYVTLGDGSRGMLPDKWLERFSALADLSEPHDGKLRFKPAQSLLLDALLSEKSADMQVEVDRQFQRFRQKLRKFSGVKPRKAPRGFRGKLRAYQEAGLGWLNFLEEFGLGGCLADDMGLGKTIQVLAWLLARRSRAKGGRAKPTLIVVPKSLVFNWIEETKRFAPKLSTLDYTGLDRSERAAEIDRCDIVLTTYGTLRRDITQLKDRRFDCVILDEAQAIKNDSSQTAKACRLLSADLRLALTGTPIENHLGELWSLCEFLNPGMLGRSGPFRAYCQQAEENPEAREMLCRGLAPFVLRRTKQQVLKELPEKTEQTIHCELSPIERKQYSQLRDYYRASLTERIDRNGINQSKMHVLEALLRLRQAACHPGLLDKKLRSKSSAKLDALLEQLREIIAEGHKALVFSQFTSLLHIVRTRLDSEQIVYEYLDGRTRQRQEKVERFQTDPDCPLFLISLKAGGYGLNLTAADYVFLLDPWWNPAVEAQAIDRTHRIGQTRHVFAYRLIAADTVEEKILELQQQKREMAEAIISSNSNVLAKLTVEDLQLLLS